MKSVILLFCFLLISQTTDAFNLFNSPQHRFLTAADGFRYEICDKENNAFDVQSITISPDPPQRSQKLTVKVTGTLNKVVDSGTTLNVVVRYMRIKLYDNSLNLCEELGKVGDAPEKCPLQPGVKDWTYSVDLPDTIPPGRYSVDVKINNQDSQQVVCAKIVVGF